LKGILKIYALRYLRLTPLLAYVVVSAPLLKYGGGGGGGGAIWFHFQRSSMWGNADKYGWAVLLYLNDYVPFKDGYSAGPFQWTWYLADDFKFFVVSTPLLMLYGRGHPRTTFGILAGIMAASFWCNAAQRTFIQQDSYYHPLNRCPPYVWGLLAGLLASHLGAALHQLASGRETTPSASAPSASVRNGQTYRLDGQLHGDRQPECLDIATRLPLMDNASEEDGDEVVSDDRSQWSKRMLGIIQQRSTRLGLYGAAVGLLCSTQWLQSRRVLAHFASLYRPDMEIRDWSPKAQAWFSAYYVFAWGLGISLLAVPWALGYGGGLRRFLEHRWFCPLAKLTYGVYLVHPFMNLVLTYQANTWFIITPTNLLLMWIPLAILATVTSFVLWMLVEKPMANVVDLLVRGPTPR